MTIVSPGTTSPTSTEVSSMMPTKASSVRSTGSTDCTMSRMLRSTPLSHPANQSMGFPATFPASNANSTTDRAY